MNKFSKKYQITSIELEPTHYKADLWNKIAECPELDVHVVYTQAKNWAPDGGHNYLRFPEHNYKKTVMSGRGILGAVGSGIKVMKTIISNRADVVLICGYSQLPSFFALMLSFMMRKNFYLFVDEFNIDFPPGRYSHFKWIVRESLRKFCFRFAEAILVCGKRGKESALAAGCPSEKVDDFPYVIDVGRLATDSPNDIPVPCIEDVEQRKRILFFSGRMIKRKGLQTLLLAISKLKIEKDWILWIEGDGPEIDTYRAMAQEHRLEKQCRFLGFCQYDLHSWLLRNAEIIIVPSLEDNWGIVVDEGLQLGKVVISSEATGSGYDRIIDKNNGYIFQAGRVDQLSELLEQLITNDKMRANIGNSALHSDNIVPSDNLNTILRLIKKT